MRQIWPIFVLFCGCGGAALSPPAPVPPPADVPATPAPGPTVEPLEGADSPPASPKTPPMQIVVNELAKGGWMCAPRNGVMPAIDCPADAHHKAAVRITYSNIESGCSSDEPCFLRLESYGAPRAFGKPCEKFEDAMNDLAIAAHHFSVTCSDTTGDPMTSRQFGFMTAITVTDASQPGVLAALSLHETDRAAAIEKLVSIKAVERLKPAGSRDPHG